MSKNNSVLKLNLGCGTDYLVGYVNIDIRKDIGADLVHDITKPFPYSDNSISEIIAFDVFEHLIQSQQSTLFSELSRLSLPRGILKVRIPDLEDIWERFATDPDTRNLFLYGDTSESGIWGAHKSGHTLVSFCTLAGSFGFSLTKFTRLNTNLEIEFTKTDNPSLTGIIFINQSLGMGGAEKFNLQLLSWLSGQNIPIQAWVAKSDFRLLLHRSGIKAHRLPFIVDLIGDWKGLIKGLLLSPIALFYYIYLVLKTHGQGTYYLSGYIEKIYITPIAKLLHQPVVWVEFGPLENIFAKFFGLPKLLYRLVSQLPDYVIEPSQFTFIHNLNITNLSHARTKIIPCSVSDPDIQIINSTTRKLSNSVYTVSRLQPGKGQDLLISAWPGVLAVVPQAKLYLIGEGDFRSVLESLVSKLSLSASVIFLGRVDNLPQTIAPFSVGVFPSVWPLEGFGLVLLEAMSQAKPLICSDTGPYPEIVDQTSAILVNPVDSQDLSRAIITLLKNPDRAKTLGLAGLKRFNTLFAWPKISPLYKNVFLLAQIRSRIIDQLSR